jgi:hypothetical protein
MGRSIEQTRKQEKAKAPKARKLTEKQRAYVRMRLDNPKMTKTRAAMSVYNASSPQSANAIATSLEKKPQIQSALMAYSDLAESTIVGAIQEYRDSDKQWQRTLAVESSKWVHDKVHGKAVQQVNNINQNFTGHVQQKVQEYEL